MIYTSVILELLKEKNYQEDIEIITSGLLNKASNQDDASSIRQLSYFLEGLKEAFLIVSNKSKKDFIEQIILKINEKGDNYNAGN